MAIPTSFMKKDENSNLGPINICMNLNQTIVYDFCFVMSFLVLQKREIVALL